MFTALHSWMYYEAVLFTPAIHILFLHYPLLNCPVKYAWGF